MRTLVVHHTTGSRYKHVGMADFMDGRIKYTTYRDGVVYNDHMDTEFEDEDHEYWISVIHPPQK